MVIFNMYIFNAKGTCIYYEEWNVNRKDVNLRENTRNLYGLLFELKRFVIKTSLNGEAPEYFSYTTNKYKLHCYETATGKRFIVTTDPKVGSLHSELKEVYSTIYVENVVRNPLSKVNESIQDCDTFVAELGKYLRELPCWR